MYSATSTAQRWRATALCGACLITLAIVAGYFDVATNFTFEWISDYFGLFLSGLLIGVAMAFVGCIGWATKLENGHRAKMALLVFGMPWTLLLLGLPIGGTNIHGPAAPVMMLILPAAVLAVVLLIMAARKKATSNVR